jgi:hypothetical protein
MKKILVTFLSTFSFINLVFAESSEKSIIFRTNVIYIDEILGDLNGGDNGAGPTAELSFLLGEIDNFYHTIGFEAGYIKSDVNSGINGVDVKFKTELVPVFLNYTIGADFDGNTGDKSGFVWEAGLGLGGFFADVEFDANSSSESDNDFVFGGQVFASVGYGFSEVAGVHIGGRYMLAEDGSFSFENFGTEAEGEVVNSFAIDVSLNYTF